MHNGIPGPYRYAIYLLFIQALLFAIAQPFGEFPINDDWAYAQSVIWLTEQGRFALSDWIAMNLLPQTLMGAVVTEIYGFSFSNLRGLTQAVAIVTSLSAYSLFLACGLTLRSALLGSVALVCLPWWQLLANTYMSDMYGLLFALLSAHALIRFLHTTRLRFLILGSLFSAIGTLERQVVLVIPVGFACAQIYLHGPRSWRILAAAMTPALFALVAVFVYQSWLTAGAGIPVAQQSSHGRAYHFVMLMLSLDVHRWTKFAQKTVEMAGYLGLFLVVPLSALYFTRGKRAKNLGAILAALAVFGISLSLGWLPPYRENNLITVNGIGPYTLVDGFIPASSLDSNKGWFWQFAGAMASLGIVLLISSFTNIRAALFNRPRAESAALVMIGTITVFYLLPFAITDYFDRYLLFVYPFLYAGLASAFNHGGSMARINLGAAMAFTTLIGLISAVAVHYYFSWNNARWALIHYAENKLGAGPSNMDGGFEYNGFHNFESEKHASRNDEKSWWWVVDDSFSVAFGLLPGYTSIRQADVNGYLHATPNSVHLLKRNE